jgi:DNA polymerase-1
MAFSSELASAPSSGPDADEIFLVDGSGYIFRAYFALPQTLTNPEGVPVGAVLGFTNMMWKLLNDMKAPSIAVIFDAPVKNFRYGLYEQYKANRDETPKDLIPQFGLIRDATRAFGIPALELDGYEADDLIATYARLAGEAGRKVTIVGSDKDLMQLVGGHVRMYDPVKNKYIGPDEVMEKFGVPPEKVIDVQALAGDSTDNIPGVPGIGVKTAAQLINEYGSLEDLLARAGEIKQPKRRELLQNHAADALLSKKLVTLAQDAAVPVSIADMRAHDPKTPALAAFLKQQGFRTLLARVESDTPSPSPLPAERGLKKQAPTDSLSSGESGGEGGGEARAAAPILPNPCDNQYTLITDAATLRQWMDRAREVGVLAVDTETTSLTPARAKLVGISICSDLGRAAYIPIGHVAHGDLLGGGNTAHLDQMPALEVMAIMKPVLEDPEILNIGHII